MNYSTGFKSVRGSVSAAEWQTRVDLAACYRLVAKYGMTDLIYNHITARVPGPEHHIAERERSMAVPMVLATTARRN